MMKKIIKVLIISTFLITLFACKQNSLQQFKETTFNVGFNTPFTLIAYSESEEEFTKLFEQMKKEISEMNQLYDIYNDYENVNNIKTINDNAGKKAVKVDQKIIDLLLLSKEYSEKTNNKFNPTLGPVLKIWHDARERGIEANRKDEYIASPSQAVLEEANQYVSWDFVEIDSEKNTVYLKDENAALDLGAIAKGYAVEMAAQSLEASGLKHGVVNGGGNVKTINSKPDEKWRVGITHPNEAVHTSILSLAFDSSMSIVTSGDYERYFIDDKGLRQHHLIDSFTLQPARIGRSITVTTEDSTLADSLSTAFSMTSLDDAKEFSESLNIKDLGLVYVFETKQDNQDFNFKEVDGMYVYYNDVIKDNLN